MLDQLDLGSMVDFVMEIKTSPPWREEELPFCWRKTQPPKPSMCCGSAPNPCISTKAAIHRFYLQWKSGVG